MLVRIILAANLAIISGSLHAAVHTDKVEYKGWRNCYRISNGEIELIVTADVGPRVIRFGFIGRQNLFKEYPEQLGKSGEQSFQLRGGHRLWKAPEDPIATWASDNVPVEIEVKLAGLVAREPIEPTTKLQKELEIIMAQTGSTVTVVHRIWNHSLFPLEFAPWALTMMAQGGTLVAGFPPRGSHPANLAPTNPLVMWAYTNLSDPRWKFTRRYLTLQQDPRNADAQKLGLFNPDTWAVYLLNGEAFVKRTTADTARPYADFGCSFETFTNNEFLEIETLGPLTRVLPEHKVEHVERWALLRAAKPAELTDEKLATVITPLIQDTRNLK